MGSLPPELSLDLRPTSDSKRVIEFLKEVSSISIVEDKVSKLEEVVKMLEDERRKIDAFKSELPLCIHIMNDVIWRMGIGANFIVETGVVVTFLISFNISSIFLSLQQIPRLVWLWGFDFWINGLILFVFAAISNLKDELAQCMVPEVKPVLEQFMPLKKEHVKDEKNINKNDYRDKKNWMSSVQLWNTNASPSTTYTQEPKGISKLNNKKQEDHQSLQRAEMFQTSTDRNGGRGFVAVKTYSSVPFMMVRKKEEKEESPVHDLSLLTPVIKNSSVQSGSSASRTSCSRAVANAQSNLRSGENQTSRKQRRCWSPELHRRFVSALQQLGGAQAATPKQIRELMQVEGLTNDEVKSHLQKYRLHTRRLPAATAASANQSVMVLGGLWMSQDQYGDSSKGSSSQSDSPQGPFQLAGSGGGSSPVGENRMEDDEDDEKSESYSWKSHINTGKEGV